jgi:4'-phosphopantetheinyl transferase
MLASSCKIKIASTSEICCDISLLPQQEQQRYQKYKNKNAAELFLLGRTLLRHGLSEYYSLPFDVDIEIDDNGKPYIPPKGKTPPYFSVSHSHEKAVVVFAQKPVGVDIEKIVTHSRETLLAMGQKVFSDNEMLLLESVTYAPNAENTPSVQEYFTKMWVIKEAFVKATGAGLAYSSEIDLSAIKGYKCFLERVLPSFNENFDYIVKGYKCFLESISDDYFLSVTVKS